MSDFFRELFAGIQDPERIEVAYVVGKNWRKRYVDPVKVEDVARRYAGQGCDVYFGVCTRRPVNGEYRGRKENFGRAYAIWGDADDGLDAALRWILPPSALVQTSEGHGHFYWFLESPSDDVEQVEDLVRSMADYFGWDKTQNVNRLLRVPGTWNFKGPEPVPVELAFLSPKHRYRLSDLRAALALSTSGDWAARVATGEWEDRWPSRSERDMALAFALRSRGMRREMVEFVFRHHSSLELDRKSDPEDYLRRTLDKVYAGSGALLIESELRLAPDGIYWGNERKLGSFVPSRLILLRGIDGSGDAFDAVLTVGDSTFRVLLPKKAFASATRLMDALGPAELVWVGSDRQTRLLWSFLLQQWDGEIRHAVPCLGRHTVDGEDVFVGSDVMISPQGWVPIETAPVRTLTVGREHPETSYSFTPREELRTFLKQLLPCVVKLHHPHVVWALLGWFAASLYKPRLHAQGVRLPHLNLAGPRGAGKTTLVRVFQEIFGIQPTGWDCNTTAFVRLTLLGSTNAIPVHLMEHRIDALGLKYPEIVRVLLLAYDTGMDARGRPDRTTERYLLTAPIILDGEDPVEDPALRERTVILWLSSDVIREGAEGYLAYQQLRRLGPLGRAAGLFVQFTLNRRYEPSWDEALELTRQLYPSPLPDRPRRNIATIVFGLRAFEQFLKVVGITADLVNLERARDYIAQIVTETVGTEAERSSLAADKFVEAVVIHALRQGQGFLYLKSGSVLWFHLASAYDWYAKEHRRETILRRRAIAQQLRELGYVGEAERQRTTTGLRVRMWPVDLNLAKKRLDIPLVESEEEIPF